MFYNKLFILIVHLMFCIPVNNSQHTKAVAHVETYIFLSLYQVT